MEKYKEYEQNLRDRYTNLFGENGCELWMIRERRKMMIIVVILVVIFVVIVCNDSIVKRNQYSNIKFNEKGEMIGVVRPEGEESYSFTTKVKIISSEGKSEQEYYITIEPAGKKNTQLEQEIISADSQKKSAENELKKLISGLNDDTTSSTVELPDSLANGDEIIWMKADNNDPVIYIIGMVMLLYLIYRNRFHAILKEEQKAKESIIKELPDFINKVVLLVNAGVILNTAIIKIIDNYDKNKIKDNYFYRRISEIIYMVNETNASLYQELYVFARNSGVKELMRITNIILDNLNKGDDLSDKLRRENELLWFARKQQAEEKGKLAETKLTLPLMILLTVLILVTIAPALMEI